MKLSAVSRYALHSVAHLAARSGDGLVTADTIAAAHQIPWGMVHRVLNRLVAVGVVRSLKGPNGGYRLARAASKITLLEVIEAVDGPLHGEVGAPEAVDVRQDLDTRLATICDEAAALVRRQFGKVWLSDLVGGE